MNKKLLSVVIGAALSASINVAQADVQLYGQVDVSVDTHDCDNNICSGYSSDFTGGTGQDMNMNGNFSYLGVKGSEDIGNGLKAIFNVMFAFDPAGDTAGFNSNEKWLGLAGDFGTVRAGTVTTPYNDHGGMIDPFADTSLAGSTGGLQSSYLHDSTANAVANDYAGGLSNRTIRYDSMDYNGVSGGVFYTLGGESGAHPGASPDNAYGVGGQYKNGNILAFADYLTANTNMGPNTNDTAWDIGGQYTMGNIAMFGMYEQGGLVSSSLRADANAWHLGGSFTMGNTLAYLAYGMGDGDVNGTETDEHSAWTLGVKHSLSTRTSVYAGFNQIDVSGNVGQTDHFGMGMNVKF